MSYFEHLGVNGSSAYTTFDTILTDILTDMGCNPAVTPISPLPSAALAGTGSQWTVYDDLRSDSLAYAISAINGTVGWSGDSIAAPAGVTAPGNVSTITGSSTKFQKEFPIGCYIKHPTAGTYWQVVGFNQSTPDTTMYVDASGGTPASTVTGQVAKRKATAIVLKCNSTQKPFYVQLIAPKDGRWLLVCNVWEYWNNTGSAVTLGGSSVPAHSGLNGFNLTGTNSQTMGGGRIRSYFLSSSTAGQGFNDNWVTNAKPLSTACVYILSLLNDSFILYGGGYGGNGQACHDMFIAQNLTPYRTSPLDTDCLIAGCTNARYGAGTNDTSWANVQASSGANPSGGCYILRNLNGTLWQGNYMIWPKAPCYLYDFNRSVVNREGSFDVTDLQVWQGASSSTQTTPEQKRGDVINLKLPLGNPGNLGFAKFNVNENGVVRQHILVNVDAPDTTSASVQDLNEGNTTNTSTTSGSVFECAMRSGSGGGVITTNGYMFRPRWILFPTT